MAYNTDPYFSQGFIGASASLAANSTAGALNTSTNGVTIFTAGANGAWIDSLIFFSNDSQANNLFLYIDFGSGVVGTVGQINIPITAGDAANVLAIDGMNPAVIVGLAISATGKRIIKLPPNAKLGFSMFAASANAKTIYVTATGETL